jgi:glutathione synthase/RimK-type ligase-like ATP-grasp enzyme
LATIPEHVYQFATQCGYPFVLKPSKSYGARGVVPVANYLDIRARVEPSMDGQTSYVLQQLVSFRGAQGQVRDRKAVVVGGRVVTVMQRTGPVGEIAASRNGGEDSIDLASLLPVESKYLPAAVDALGLTWGSVDYWLTDDHPEGIMINEVNAFPYLPPREAQPFAEAVVAVISERVSITTRDGEPRRNPTKRRDP